MPFAPNDQAPKPMTLAAYNRRFHRNLAITGFGVETTVSTPCPFCAAADWMVYRILDFRESLAKGATCKACGRSAKAIFFAGPGGSTSFELVQTDGPTQPEWLEPKMRRI